MSTKAIGYKDDSGNYGFRFTEDGRIYLGNTADDIISVTGTLDLNGNLNVYNDVVVRNTTYSYNTSTTHFQENFEGLSDGSTSDPSTNGTWTNGLGSKLGDSIANGVSWIAEDTDANSASTGPDNAHSGSIYVFTEASSRTNKYYTLQRSFTSEQSKLISKLSLYYHMYGSSMGTLSVYASGSYANSGGWTQINITADADGTPATASTISGQQHTAEDEAYKRAEVDLEAYSSSDFSIRIVGLTGNSFPSDLAIDAIEFIPKQVTLSVSPTTVSSSVPVTASAFYSDAVHTDEDSLYVDVVRRKSDSSTTTKIRLQDEVVKIYAGNANDEVLKVESDGIGVNGYIRHLDDTDTHLNFSDDKIVLKAGNKAMVTMEEKGSAPHEVTINDGGNNIDFVVKGNGSNEGNPLFMCDASSGRVGINGVGSPSYELDVDGTVGATAFSGSVFVATGDVIIGDTSGTSNERVKIVGGVDSNINLLVMGADDTTEYLGAGVLAGVPTITAGYVNTGDAHLGFATEDNGTIAEKMRITKGGKVLVNATAHQDYGSLEVKQPADTIDDGITVYNSGNGRALRLWCDSSNVARIDSGGTGVADLAINYGGGQVAIGNASIESTAGILEVHQSSLGGGKGLVIWGSGTSGTKEYLTLDIASSGVAMITAGRKSSSADCALSFRTSDTTEAERMRITPEGELLVNINARQTDEGLIQIKQKADAPQGGGLTIIRSGWTDAWTIWQSTGENLYFSKNGTSKAYIDDGTAVDQLDFTGQHRCSPSQSDSFSNLSSSVGKIVVSSGVYKNLNLSSSASINESIPTVELSSEVMQKSVFGVVSNAEDDNPEREYFQGAFVSVFEKPAGDDRLYINSLGEGGIWITNINGNIENGDYITTCEIPGYGMKQDDDLLHNYTVAKITQDCLFDLNSTTYECEEIQHDNQTYKAAFVGCTYHCG